MFNLNNVFSHTKLKALAEKDKIAKVLQTTPEALEAFERAYQDNALMDTQSDNFFEQCAKQAIAKNHPEGSESIPIDMVERIVDELLQQTVAYVYNGKADSKRLYQHNALGPAVSNEEIQTLPYSLRPQLTGTLMKREIREPAYTMIVQMYADYRATKNMQYYHLFRQGLDIQDLDSIMYQMIGTNPNSMGHWLSALVEAVKDSAFFKIPATTIIKVPLTLLQLTRCEYSALTATTLKIVDRFCEKAFGLDRKKEYFIKTGTYSSKFDFRNAHVHGEKEVAELGEYLLYIQHQAVMMAGPLTSPCIYGVSTTNEWVVREFIPDKENNPCIYKGLPLHTEYRVFVDCDTNTVLGISPYWGPNTMEKRFGHKEDANSPHQIHDYIIYKSHKETLMRRYEENKDRVRMEIETLLPRLHLSGQWSIDVMQNGDDFWLIDMALAQNSALIECVPENLRKVTEENWIPKLALTSEKKNNEEVLPKIQ